MAPSRFPVDNSPEVGGESLQGERAPMGPSGFGVSGEGPLEEGEGEGDLVDDGRDDGGDEGGTSKHIMCHAYAQVLIFLAKSEEFSFTVELTSLQN